MLADRADKSPCSNCDNLQLRASLFSANVVEMRESLGKERKSSSIKEWS